jgi:hypothetical protein
MMHHHRGQGSVYSSIGPAWSGFVTASSANTNSEFIHDGLVFFFSYESWDFTRCVWNFGVYSDNVVQVANMGRVVRITQWNGVERYVLGIEGKEGLKLELGFDILT